MAQQFLAYLLALFGGGGGGGGEEVRTILGYWITGLQSLSPDKVRIQDFGNRGGGSE